MGENTLNVQNTKIYELRDVASLSRSKLLIYCSSKVRIHNNVAYYLDNNFVQIY